MTTDTTPDARPDLRCAMLAIALLAATALPAGAHGDEDRAKPPGTAISTDRHPFGVEGDPKRASRTIAVSMDDTMRYSRGEIQVRQGETVTFVVTNRGKLMHEFVLGTEAELRKHAEMMRKHSAMKHDEPYMAHVMPGATERLTWTFTNAGTFLYGCLVPGHFEAGMKGKVVVAAKR